MDLSRSAVRYLSIAGHDGNGKIENILELVRSRLIYAHSGNKPERQVIVLDVRPHDGATWITGHAQKCCKEQFPRTKSILLNGTINPGGLPQIGRIITDRRLCAIAQKTGVTTRFRKLGWQWIAGAILVILVGGALLAALSASKSPAQDPGRLLTDPVFLSSAVAAIILGLAVKYAQDILTPGLRKAAVTDLPKDIDEARHDQSARYGEFIEALAAELATPRHNRAIFVDDADALDDVTFQALKRWIQNPGYGYSFADFIFVVEQDPPGVMAREFMKERVRAVFHAQEMDVYRLLPLSYYERARLATDLGHPDRSSYETVGAIFDEPSGYHDQLAKIVNRERGPGLERRDRYDCVDLAYLLSLPASSYGEVSWDKDHLVQWLTHLPTDCLPLLRSVLPDFHPDPYEVSKVLDQVFERFASVLDRHGDNYISFPREVGEVFDACGKSWHLQDPGPGHLFWAIVTSDLAGMPQLKEYWVDKAAHHILLATIPDVADEARNSIRFLLAETALKILQESIISCMTDMLRQLAENVYYLVDYADFPARLSNASSLLWMVSSITGDRRIEGFASRLAYQTKPPPTHEPESALLALRRDFLEFSRDIWRGDNQQAGIPDEAIAFHESEAAWLAVEMFDVSADARIALPELTGWISDVVRLLSGDISRPPRAGGADSPTMEVAYAWSLLRDANLVWAAGLASDSLIRDISGPGVATIDVLIGKFMHTVASRLRVAFENACHVNADSVLVGLLRQELLVTLAAAGLIAANDCEADKAEAVSELAARAAKEAGIDISRDAVGDALDLLSIAWHAVGLPRQGKIDRIRLGEYRLIVTADREQMNPVHIAFRILSTKVADDPLIGLLADLTMAANVRSPRIFRARVAIRAAQDAINLHLGDDVVSALSIIALLSASDFRIECGSLVEYLLRSTNRIDRKVAACQENALPSLLLAMLNGALSCPTGDTHASIMSMARERLSTVTDATIRELISVYLDLQDVQSALTWPRPIEVSAALSRWQSRPKDGQYVFLLHLLLQVPGLAADDYATALSAALEALHNIDLTSVARNHVLLAALVYRLITQGPVADTDPAYTSSALDILDHAIEGYDESINPDLNVAVYETLIETRGSTDSRRQRLAWWQDAKLAQAEVGRIPQLISTGQFFQLFFYYCQTLRHYGLPLDTHDLPAGLASGRPDTRLRQEWRTAGESPVDALLRVGDRTLVSARFIMLGSALFSGDSLRDPSYADARTAFNDEAARHLGDLLALLANLTDVPEPIRRTLQRHKSRFGAPAMA